MPESKKETQYWSGVAGRGVAQARKLLKKQAAKPETTKRTGGRALRGAFSKRLKKDIDPYKSWPVKKKKKTRLDRISELRKAYLKSRKAYLEGVSKF
jgi:hypothetical protein